MLEYIFPVFNTCALCKKEDSFSFEWGLCETCFGKLKFSTRHDGAIEYDDFSKIMVLDLKYNGKRYFAKVLAKLAKEKVEKIDYDLITFVPRYEGKNSIAKKRDYNQGKLIAKALDKNAIPLLKKVRDTKSQTDLEKEERLVNLLNSFKILDEIKIKNKKILIVDDVITTGATLMECKKTLLNSGAKEVHIFGVCV